jgi:centromeric protein E
VFGAFGCSEREYQRGDEITWYADGDKIVRNAYNPATAYAFGIIFIFVIIRI